MSTRLLISIAAVLAALSIVADAGGRSPRDRVLAGLLCIHRYEGSWRDAGAPYYGGLQMDWSFMAAYGGPFLRSLGTADHWPIEIQLAVGYAGYLARGWSPWPNTARYCGLR